MLLVTAFVALASAADTARAAPAVSPAVFGKVFRARRGTLVRVFTGARRPATGFLIGAEGEVVFGARRPPAAGAIVIETADGQRLDARLLGHDRRLGLGLARMAPTSARPPPPLLAAADPRLWPDRWVVVLAHDASGSAQPFAGVIEAAPATRYARKKRHRGLTVAPLGAPGDVGSPVLSIRGELVGVVVDGGRRRCRVAPLDVVRPFLEASVPRAPADGRAAVTTDG